MTSRTPNTAAQSALAQVVQAEQRRTLARMAVVRLVVASLCVLAVVFVPAPPDVDLTPTLIGSPMYLLAAFAIFAMVVLRKTTGLWSAYAIALLDIPLVVVIEWFPGAGGLRPADHAEQHRADARLHGPVGALDVAPGGSGDLGERPAGSLRDHVFSRDDGTVRFGLIRVGRPGGGLLGDGREGAPMVVESRERDLVGKYVLGERLGAGGMAEVFRATYSPEGGFERQVAVKRILPGYADNEEWVALFRREAELGATLAHPNVVQVLDFGSDGSTYFLAMEFIDGMPAGRLLARLRKTNELLSLPAVVTLAGSVVEALDYIHGRVGANGEPLHLVHRDLTPQPDDQPHRRSEAGRLWHCPERTGRLDHPGRGGARQAGVHLTRAADLFAFGVTLYELLTNHRLSYAEDDLERFNATLSKEVLPPSLFRPEIPPALDAIVLGLCERDVGKRTASAALVRQQLSQLDAALLDAARGRRALGEAIDEAAKHSGGEHLAAQVSSKPSATDRTSTSIIQQKE